MAMAALRRREVPLVGSGPVQLVLQDGRYLLIQGVSAIDVTSIIGDVNYGLGRVALGIRLSRGKTVAVRRQDEPDVEGAGQSADVP